MRVLVTGGAGFVGQHLVRWLAARDAQVRVLDTAAPPTDLPAGYEQGSILDAGLVARLVPAADVVVHLAGVAQPLHYGHDPLGTLDVHLVGSLQLVRSCADHGVPVLFASTSEIYGVNPQVPWTEDAARVLGPVSHVRWCYATAKAAVEHYLDACRRQRGLGYTVVRLFNVYGPGLRGRVVDAFIDRAVAGQPLVVHGNGLQSRTFCYIDDAVDALGRLVQGGHFDGRTFNLGSTEPTRILDLAGLVIDLAGSASVIEHVAYSNLYEGFDDIPARQPDVARIATELGWTASTPLAAGLARMIAAHRLQGPRAGTGASA